MVLDIDGLLPSIGSEIPYSCHGDIYMMMGGMDPMPLSFKGGITMRVEEKLSEGLGGVRLRVIGCELSANCPVYGRVTISQSDIDKTPLSQLQIIKTLPPTFQHIIFLDFTMTIETPTTGDGSPLVVLNTETVELVNDKLMQFPPQDAVHKVKHAFGLAPDWDPKYFVGGILGVCNSFLTITHNPSPAGLGAVAVD